MIKAPSLLSGTNRYPKSSFHDAVASLTAWRLWLVLGFKEVNAQYQRALIGPLWLTVHAAVWIAAVTYIFAVVIGFDTEIARYSVYVASGIVMFNFITNIVTGGSEVFIKSRIMIHSHPNPLLIHPMRLAASSAYQLALQIPVVLAVFILFGVSVSETVWLAVPGIAANLAVAINVSLLFALAGARFGDFRFITLAGMRLALFVTPVFWPADRLGDSARWIVDLNPLSHFIAIVRDPLLGEPAALLSWAVVGGWFLVTFLIAGAWFVATRRSIAMWV